MSRYRRRRERVCEAESDGQGTLGFKQQNLPSGLG